MKHILYVFLLKIAVTPLLISQSVFTLDAGTTMGVLTGADLCANSINGSGIIYGGGTVCGGLVAMEPQLFNELPKTYALSRNYPNPFNPITTILYQLPVAGKVRITVFDILGQEVMVLVNSYLSAGYYSVQFDAMQVASGIYIYKIEAGNFIKSIKMSVTK